MAEQDGILIVHEAELVPKRKAEHPDYAYIKREVTPRSRFSQCYVALYELPPHKANYPYHYHLANTETFYIRSGEGVLVTPEGEKSVRAGDFIVCPPGACGAHKLRNASETEPLRYIDFDTANSPDVVHYPDSGKTGVIERAKSSTFFRDADARDYYDGE